MYQLYTANPVTSFSRIVLRSGYDDTVEPTAGGENAKGTLLRDPLETELWRKIGGLVSRSKFAVPLYGHYLQWHLRHQRKRR